MSRWWGGTWLSWLTWWLRCTQAVLSCPTKSCCRWDLLSGKLHQTKSFTFTIYTHFILRDVYYLLMFNIIIWFTLWDKLSYVSCFPETICGEASLTFLSVFPHLQQLYGTCKDMQDKLVELIPRISEEKLIEELLVTNDEINTTFTRYKRSPTGF